METAGQITLVAVVAAALYWAVQPQYLFVIAISNGQPRMKHGKVTAAFLAEVAAVCREIDLGHGWIGGQKRGERIRLHFSRDFGPGVQQRVRNWWALNE